jgi:hypothetical protein
LTSGQAHAAQLFSHAIGNWVFTQLKGSEGACYAGKFYRLFTGSSIVEMMTGLRVSIHMSVIFKTSENKTSSSTDPDKFLEKYLHIYKQAVALLERLLL